MSPSRIRTTGWTLAGFALIAIMELKIVPYIADSLPPKNEQYGRMLFIQETAISPTSFDILFLGDSTAKRSIIPPLFAAQTHLTGFNLASYGILSPFADPSILRQYTDHHAPPRAVVIVNTINAGSRPLDRNALLDYFPDGLAITTRLVKERIWPFHSLLQAAASKVLPSFRVHNHIRRSLTPALFGTYQESAPTEQIQGMGGLEADFIAEWGEEFEIDNASWDFTPRSEFGVLLHFTCEEAHRLGTTAFFTFGPMSDAFTAPERRDRVLQKMKAVADFLATEQGCIYVDGARVYEDRYLSNDTHVNETGAILFTQQLAQELMPLLQP